MRGVYYLVTGLLLRAVLIILMLLNGACTSSWMRAGNDAPGLFEEDIALPPAQSKISRQEVVQTETVQGKVIDKNVKYRAETVGLPKVTSVQVAGPHDIEKQARFSLDKPPDVQALLRSEEQPPDANDLSVLLDQWFFGQGLGETVLNIGTVIAAPFYAVYLVGNAGAELAGYERLSPFNSLPADAVEPVAIVYDGVTSVPGFISSLVFGKEFYRGESAREVVEKNRKEQLAREREEVLRVIGGETEAIRANDQ
ncbi:MAG: hypothetical protein PHC51_07445 [bacterium]|nr:hypothetical protein [bacterium]